MNHINEEYEKYIDNNYNNLFNKIHKLCNNNNANISKDNITKLEKIKEEYFEKLKGLDKLDKITVLISNLIDDITKAIKIKLPKELKIMNNNENLTYQLRTRILSKIKAKKSLAEFKDSDEYFYLVKLVYYQLKISKPNDKLTINRIATTFKKLYGITCNQNSLYYRIKNSRYRTFEALKRSFDNE